MFLVLQLMEEQVGKMYQQPLLAGGKGIARLMDKGDCGALILGTGATVMVGG